MQASQRQIGNRSLRANKVVEMANIFREAKQLLVKKDSGIKLTAEEQLTDNATDIPLTLLRIFNDTNTPDGLEELAKMLEEED